MKSAFVNAADVLTAYGYQVSNNDDRCVEVDDDFDMPIGLSRLAAGQWMLHAPPVQVPTKVSMRQARLALLAAGKLADVEAAISALANPQKEAAQIEWDYSSTVERDSNIVALLGPTVNLDDAALDALFIAASNL